MKKIYMFLIFLFISGIILAQVQPKVIGSKLTSVEIPKEINTIQASGTKGVIDSLRYDGAPATAIGTGTAADFGVYAFFNTGTLAPHAAANHYILSVKVFIYGVADVTSSELRIYADTNSAALWIQPFTPVEGWNNVQLSLPLAIPSVGNLFIGYHVVATGGHPASCDAGPINSNANWTFWNGHWTHLNNLNSAFIYKWNITAMCGTLPTTPVAGCTPLSWTTNIPVNTSDTSGTFTLSNGGGGTLTCSGITGLSAPYTTDLVPDSISLAGGTSASFKFSYNPLTVAIDTQTVVIATNAGNITIQLSGSAYNCGAAINTFPWVESFEGSIYPPSCWTKANLDGGYGWSQIYEGYTPLPNYLGGTMTVPAGGGSKAVFCTVFTGGFWGTETNDQWIITPQIAVQSGQELSFYALWYGRSQDFLDIKVSTTTNDPSSFTTTLLALDSNDYTQSGWKRFAIPLSSYAGSNVYFAFNEHVADVWTGGAFMGLDLIKIDTISTSAVAECAPLSWVAGNLPINTTVTSGTYTLTNAGLDTLTCSGITGLSAPYTTTLVPATVNIPYGESKTFTFSYHPLTLATNNQTVVIATSGGNITIDLTGSGVSCGTAITTYPWTEGFEGVLFPPACWTSNDADGDGFNWAPMSLSNLDAHTGLKFAASASYDYITEDLYPNNYLITPKLNINASNLKLTYWVASDIMAPEENYMVMVSTTGVAPANFTEVFYEKLVTGGVWAQRTVNLGAYYGQNIYIAFVHDHETFLEFSQAHLQIDDVKISGLQVPIAACTPLSWSAGNVPINTSVTSGTFTLKNTGATTLTCSGITGLSSPYTTTLVPASVSLAAGATKTFTFTFHPLAVGTSNKTVVITTNGGNISINLTGNGVNNSGVNSYTDNSDVVTLYPNPAEDHLNIEANFNIQNIRIFNGFGQLVIEQTIEDESVTINIASLTKGLYFVELMGENKTYTKKISVYR